MKRERAVADQASAQQRGRLLVGQIVGQRQAVALVGGGQLRVAAVDVASGEARVDAQVLPVGCAVAAGPVGPAQPGDADALPVLGARDDLVAEDDRKLGRLDLAVAQVQIGAADAAGADLQQQLPGPGVGSGRVVTA